MDYYFLTAIFMGLFPVIFIVFAFVIVFKLHSSDRTLLRGVGKMTIISYSLRTFF